MSAQARKPAVFPSLTSYSLDRQKVDMPSGFEGQIDLLMISFQAEQQKDLETWFPVAQAIQHSNFSFRYYRLPVSARENMLFRWWEVSSMRSDETDPETWHWIVPLFVDKNSFRQSLQIPDERQIALLLTDRQGHVLWQAYGPLTPEKKASLLAAVAATHQN
uniref:Uncharacterized protein n=1 Tax=Paracidobacterium acidisoli TaxID=2303751 RepID=A0A372IS81_9BACT